MEQAEKHLDHLRAPREFMAGYQIGAAMTELSIEEPLKRRFDLPRDYRVMIYRLAGTLGYITEFSKDYDNGTDTVTFTKLDPNTPAGS